MFKYLAVSLPLAFGFVLPAHAALNAAVSTAFTALQTDILALIDMVWPVMIAVTVAFIILRLFPRAASSVA